LDAVPDPDLLAVVADHAVEDDDAAAVAEDFDMPGAEADGEQEEHESSSQDDGDDSDSGGSDGPADGRDGIAGDHALGAPAVDDTHAAVGTHAAVDGTHGAVPVPGGGEGKRRTVGNRRGKLVPPSYMWGPFRMTHRPPKGRAKFASWQITCPFHDCKQKTKCTRTFTIKSHNPQDSEVGQMRLHFWGVQGLLKDSRKAHQNALGNTKDWPAAFKKLSAEQMGTLRNKLEVKMQRCEEELAKIAARGSSSSSSNSTSTSSSSISSSSGSSSSSSDQSSSSSDEDDEDSKAKKEEARPPKRGRRG